MAAPLEHTLLAVTFERHPASSWHDKVPPHITLMPWFDGRSKGVMEEIETIIEQTAPLRFRKGRTVILGGVGHEKLAVQVESESFRRLHRQLFDSLINMGVGLPDSQWLGGNFMPHYRLRDGYEPFYYRHDFCADEIAIIDNIAVEGADRGIKHIRYQRLAGVDG